MKDLVRVALLALVLGSGGCSGPNQDSVVVLSFNIRYGTANDGPDRWELRRELTLRTLRAAQADIIGIQEALAFQVDEIAAALPGYSHVGVGRDDGARAGEFVPIFFRSGRFREAGSGHFWFSETPDVPGSTNWGNSITRMCTWIELTDLRTGSTITVFNTHWDHESQASREASGALLRERIGEVAETRVIVTGDFNAGPTNQAVQVLTGERVTVPGLRLIDSYLALHPASENLATYHAFRGTTNGEKIDAILVGPGWVVESADIDRTAYDGRFPSDHFAVLAVLDYAR